MKALFSAYWEFEKYLQKGLKDYGLNYGNPKVLLYILQNEGCKQADIAKGSYVEPATVSTVLSNMEEKGLIERRTSVKDKRSNSIYLTDKGQKIHKIIKDQYDSTCRKAYGDFSEKEISDLQEYLLRVAANLDREEE